MKKIFGYFLILILTFLSLNALGRIVTDVLSLPFIKQAYNVSHFKGTSRLFTEYEIGPIPGNSDHIGPCFLYYRELRRIDEAASFEDIQAYYRSMQNDKEVAVFPETSEWIVQDFNVEQKLRETISKNNGKTYFYLYTSSAIPMFGFDRRCILL